MDEANTKRLHLILHEATRVVRRATTAPLDEVGVGPDEIAVEVPADTRVDLGQLVRLELDGQLVLATKAEVIEAGLDEETNEAIFRARVAAREQAKAELASIDPAKETVESIAAKVQAYFASL